MEPDDLPPSRSHPVRGGGLQHPALFHPRRPGIRTTVFIKGCPLRCDWCHNPESLDGAPEVAITEAKCTACGACIEACPESNGERPARGPDWDDGTCRRCGACAEACPGEARELIGEPRAVADLVAEVERDRPFFDASGGGVTFSGGEPLCYPTFLAACLEACREKGLHTAVDTSGFASKKVIRDIAAAGRCAALRPQAHGPRSATSATPGSTINASSRTSRTLSEEGATIWIRFPLIPGFNDDDENLEAMAAFDRRAAQPAPALCAALSPHRASTSTVAWEGRRPRSTTDRRARTRSRRSSSGCARTVSRSTPEVRMNERVNQLRRESLDAVPSVSIERALLLTEFYRENEGRWPAPLMRAHAFHHLCTHKRLHLGDGELIVGERGPAPKATPTYPEITCHSVEDLEILGSRPLTSYEVAAEDIERFADEVIPYWHGRSLARQGPRASCPKSGTTHTRPGSSPSSWSSGRRATRWPTARSTARGCSISGVRSPTALERLGDADRLRNRGQTPSARGHGCRRRCGHRLCPSPRRAGPRDGRPRGGSGAPRRARTHRRGLRAGSRPRAARLPRGAPGLLVLSPGCDHRAQRLGRLQPRPPRPASGPVLRAGSRRRNPDPRARPRSCSAASSSSSTTTPRRPRWA